MLNRSSVGGSAHHAHCGDAFKQSLQVFIAGFEHVESAFPSLRNIHNNNNFMITSF